MNIHAVRTPLPWLRLLAATVDAASGWHLFSLCAFVVEIARRFSFPHTNASAFCRITKEF